MIPRRRMQTATAIQSRSPRRRRAGARPAAVSPSGQAIALALPPLPGALTATGWALPAGLTYPEFEKVCRAFGGAARGMTNAFKWHVADLVHYAERVYGHEAYQALEFLGYSAGTLSNIARVGTAFLPPRRRGLPLTFEHFATVAALHPEEQDEWLQKAEKGPWTVAELRKAIRGEDSGPAPPACPPHTCTCGATWNGQ